MAKAKPTPTPKADEISNIAVPGSFDIHLASFNGSITVLFPKSKGITYDAAVNFAKQAQRYDEGVIGGTIYHFTAFGKEPHQIGLAISLLHALKDKKGVQALSKGKQIRNPYTAIAVLECYLTSTTLKDKRAHCVVIVNKKDIYDHYVQREVIFGIEFEVSGFATESNPETVAFPCRYLKLYGFKYQAEHPSSEEDQLEAGAARNSCDWCPNLSFQTEKGKKPK
jgi:hypothetical protein